jgi:DNA topoisomerase I
MIANGKEDRVKYLDGYYGGETGLRSRVDRQDSQIVPAEAKKLDLPIDGLDGVDILIGKFGPYVQFQDNGEAKKVSLPVSMLPGELTMEGIRSLVGRAEDGPQSLGTYPPTGEDIYVMDGRFGPYVQVGEVSDDNKKPKRASLLKGQKPEDMTLALALKLLELPRSLGMHPESGKEVKASVGRFGPYVVHDGTFKSLAKTDDVLTIDMARAVALLAEPKTGGRGKGAAAALPAKELGVGPDQKTPIQVLAGRYGPYIKYGKSNISLKKGSNPDTLTLEEALGYIAEKAKA